MSTKGFSLRKSLEKQGVTCKTAMDMHMNFVYKTLCQYPLLNIRRYVVKQDNPNSTTVSSS